MNFIDIERWLSYGVALISTPLAALLLYRVIVESGTVTTTQQGTYRTLLIVCLLLLTSSLLVAVNYTCILVWDVYSISAIATTTLLGRVLSLSLILMLLRLRRVL